MLLEGIFAAATTPFYPDERVYFRKLEYNVARLSMSALSGLVILGSTGEAVSLNDGESREVLRVAAEAAAADKVLVAGVARESVRGTLELADAAAEFGYDAVLVRNPSYYRQQLTDKALLTYYRTVADRSAVPVVLSPAAQQAVNPVQPAVFTPVAAQPMVATPAPAVASGSANSGATLGQLLAALASSQVSGGAAPPPVSSPPVSSPPVSPSMSPSAGQAAPLAGSPAPAAPRTLAAGFVLPAQPALVPVAAVALPPSFCSAEARNAFHDTAYLPSVNAAKQNNDAAAAYMRQLQTMYDQYQLSHDPDTMNAIVGAARTYQQVAQTTFSMQSALVRQFAALMTVPVVPCSQPGQPLSATLIK